MFKDNHYLSSQFRLYIYSISMCVMDLLADIEKPARLNRKHA